MPAPKFDFTSFFTVTFQRPPTPQKTPQKPTELEQKIIDVIKKNKSITREEIAKELNITPDTVKEYLEKLKKKGWLLRVGGRKQGSWEITE